MATKTPAGMEKEAALRSAGFSDQEIDQWKGETTQQLQDAGFSGKEVGEYFGVKTPDMGPTKAYFEENFKKAQAVATAEKTATAGGAPKPEPKVAGSFLQNLEAGWDMSVTGLLTSGHAPDMVLPEHAPRFARIASQIGSLAGDLPAMVAGAAGGAIAGSELPVIGTVAGAGAGAFAVPAGVRKILMDHYEKGDIKSFGDFWDRASGTMWETMKGGAVGAATATAGAAVAGFGAVAAATAEVATMTSVGAALEGHVPSFDDFVDGAILVGGLHGATVVAPKLRAIYAKTGAKPEQVAMEAKSNPVLAQELLSSNVEIPSVIQAAEAPKSPGHALEKSLEAAKADAPAPKEPAATTDAASKILSQVGVKGEKDAKGYGTKDFYKDFVDRLDPINDAVKALKKDPETLAADEHPYQLARMANDYKAKTKYMVEKGVLDYKTLQKTGPSLKEIIEPHKDNLDNFSAYLVSKRALEVEGRGLTSGFDVDAAKEVVKAGQAKYEKAAGQMVDFQNGVLKYAKDSGVLSDKSFQAMVEMGKAYIPFSRLVGEDGAGGGKAGKAGSLKAFKGSERSIQNPMASILENTEALLRMAEKNRAIDSFVKLAKKAGDDHGLIERVPDQMRPIEVKAEEAKRALEDQGAIVTRESIERDLKKKGLKFTDEQMEKALEREEGIHDGAIEAFTIFRSSPKSLGKDEFQVFRDGKREVYATTPELAEAFKALDGDTTSMHFLLKMARTLTAVKKIGIAFTPDFVARNIFRDQLTAGVFSKGGTVPFTDIVWAMGDLIGKKEPYFDWLKSGGANGTFLELDKTYLEKDVFKLDKETGFISKAWNVVKTPVDFMRVTAELTEQATRLAEFKRVSKGETSGAKVFQGGFASREVTVDFQRMGAKLSALNAITAFQNVSIQGLDRTLRAVKEDPAGVTAKAAAYITLPSVLLWWANHDDPRWNEIPRWQKDLFWIVMTKDQVYRIPKPQELGILFGSMPERALEKFFTDNPKALSDFDETLVGLVSPSFVPDAVVPVIEQHFNKSLFTGGPIVPHYLEGILPEYQYTEYSSEAGKVLAKFTGAVTGGGQKPGSLASPVVVENYIRQWTGSLGMYALQVADQLLVKSGAVPDPVKPASTLADLPAVKAFVIRYPSASAQSIQDFYSRYEENKSVIDTIRYLAKSGDFEDFEKEITLNANQEKLVSLDGIRDALSKQNKFIRYVAKNEDLKPVEKRQIIDGIYTQMIETAKYGNQLMQEVEDVFRRKPASSSADDSATTKH